MMSLQNWKVASNPVRSMVDAVEDGNTGGKSSTVPQAHSSLGLEKMRHVNEVANSVV